MERDIILSLVSTFAGVLVGGVITFIASKYYAEKAARDFIRLPSDLAKLIDEKQRQYIQVGVIALMADMLQKAAAGQIVVGASDPDDQPKG